MRKDSGITMIMMVITIVMMALIAVFSISNSKDTIVETKIIKTYDEMREVKSAIMRYVVIDNMENLSLYKTTSLKTGMVSKYGSEEQDLYELTFLSDGAVLEDILEVRNIQHDYIVNVHNLNDIEIFLVGGIEIGGVTYYTESDILEQYNDVFAGR